MSAVGVLIQEMVPADRAGVAFTINPLTGANEIVIDARTCESALGHPVDVEWAMTGNMLSILQARPITVIVTAGPRHD
jgi:phosphoenolpyruvate synthase/pyruvate phosphate dikinase